MRERDLVLKGSVCEGDFRDGIQTIQDARSAEPERCRLFPHECPSGTIDGPQCIARAGLEMAKYVMRGGTIEAEKSDFRRMARMPRGGFFDPAIEEPADGDRDMDSVTDRVAAWAERILDVHELDAASVNQEYRGDPSAVAGTYEVLSACVYDDSSRTWMHECGSTLAEAVVTHPVHLRAMPLSGFGETVQEHVPYCPSCNDKPSPNGSVVYHEDIEEAETEILRRMRDS